MTDFDPIFADVFIGDGGKQDWKAYADAGLPGMGAVFKISQGIWTYDAWAKPEIAAAKAAAGPSLGLSFFVAGYHYWMRSVDSKTQAEVFAKHAEMCGLDRDDLWPIVDVESAGNGNPSAAEIVDGASTYTERLAELGYPTVVLYGGSFLYDHGITSRLGCKWIWIARYTPTLPGNVLARIGWSASELLGWQYRGDSYNAQLRSKSGALYPDALPGLGATDLSVLTFPGGLTALAAAVKG